jgi:hypothetical protein
MSLLNDELLQAVDLALAGRWDEAHQLVQHYEDNPMASWIHAVLHQQEGDLGIRPLRSLRSFAAIVPRFSLFPKFPFDNSSGGANIKK